jgi:hypothetical protein
MNLAEIAKHLVKACLLKKIKDGTKECNSRYKNPSGTVV